MTMIDSDWRHLIPAHSYCRVELWCPGDYGSILNYMRNAPYDRPIEFGVIVRELLDAKIRIVNQSNNLVMYEGTLMDLALCRLEQRNAAPSITMDQIKEAILQSQREWNEFLNPRKKSPLPGDTDAEGRPLAALTTLPGEFPIVPELHEFEKKTGTSLCGRCSELAEASCHVQRIA